MRPGLPCQLPPQQLRVRPAPTAPAPGWPDKAGLCQQLPTPPACLRKAWTARRPSSCRLCNTFCRRSRASSCECSGRCDALLVFATPLFPWGGVENSWTAPPLHPPFVCMKIARS